MSYFMDKNIMREAIEKYFAYQEWQYEYDEDREFYTFSLEISSKIKKLTYYVDTESSNHISVYACAATLNADENTMAATAEYITRANYGLISGNFELDYRDGEVRFKNTLMVEEEDEVSQKMMERLLLIPARMFMKYGDGLAAVILGFSDPATEIEKAENPD